MNEKILIQSQRLHVRTWKQSDLDAPYHVMSQPRTHLYTQEEPWSMTYHVSKFCPPSGQFASNLEQPNQ